MPDLPISALPAAGPLADPDLFAVVQDGTTKRTTLASVADAVLADSLTQRVATSVCLTEQVFQHQSAGGAAIGSAFVDLEVVTFTPGIDCTVLISARWEFALTVLVPITTARWIIQRAIQVDGSALPPAGFVTPPNIYDGIATTPGFTRSGDWFWIVRLTGGVAHTIKTQAVLDSGGGIVSCIYNGGFLVVKPLTILAYNYADVAIPGGLVRSTGCIYNAADCTCPPSGGGSGSGSGSGPPQTWNCVEGTCVDPGDGSGTYPTLAACQAACGGGSGIVSTALGVATTGDSPTAVLTSAGLPLTAATNILVVVAYFGDGEVPSVCFDGDIGHAVLMSQFGGGSEPIFFAYLPSPGSGTHTIEVINLATSTPVDMCFFAVELQHAPNVGESSYGEGIGGDIAADSIAPASTSGPEYFQAAAIIQTQAAAGSWENGFDDGDQSVTVTTGGQLWTLRDGFLLTPHATSPSYGFILTGTGGSEWHAGMVELTQ